MQLTRVKVAAIKLTSLNNAESTIFMVTWSTMKSMKITYHKNFQVYGIYYGKILDYWLLY